MSGKSIAMTLAGLTLAVTLVFVLRGSPPAGSDDAGAAPPTDPGRGTNERLAPRPNVFGADADPAARKRREQQVASDADAADAPTSSAPRNRTTGGDGSSIDLRARLQDRSRPFAPGDGDDATEHGSRPPTDSAWRDDAAALAGTDADEPERTDPTQPVLSLFDQKGVTGAAGATVEKGVTFEDDGARFSADSELAIPMAGKISGEAGSISFWVRPEGETSDTSTALLAQVRSHYLFTDRLQIWKDGGTVRMVFADSTGTETGAMYSSPSWASDEWRLVTATWGDGENALYINGELAGKQKFEGQFNVRSDTLLHIGSNYSEDPRSLNGTISQFRVYDRALDADEIGKLPSQYPE